MLSFTLRQLTYFTAVVDAGGIAPAARRLGISAAAISGALDKLEEVTQCTLFERLPARGMELTAVGREVDLQARSLLREAEAFAQLTKRLSSTAIGHVRLGTYHGLAHVLAVPIVMHHRRAWPTVQMTVIEGGYRALLDKLETRELDLVLIYSGGDLPGDLEEEEVLRIRPKVILSRNHKLARRRQVSVSDLAEEPYILLEYDGPGQSSLEQLRAAGAAAPVAFSWPSFELVRSCVGKGLGFTLSLFQPSNTSTYHGDELVAISLKERIGETGVRAVYRKDRLQDPLVKDAIKSCSAVLRTAV